MVFVSLIVTLCLNGACIERTVTKEATMQQCRGPMALQALPQWLIENGYLDRGYTMAKWDCVPDGKKKERA